MLVKTLSAMLLAGAVWHSPVKAQTNQTSCVATAESYMLLKDAGWQTVDDQTEDNLQRLQAMTEVTINLLGFFNSADHYSGPAGTALVCATADQLLIKIHHQRNLSLEKWQSEADFPPIVTQLVAQQKTLRTRYTRACIVPGSGGDPA